MGLVWSIYDFGTVQPSNLPLTEGKTGVNEGKNKNLATTWNSGLPKKSNLK